MSEWRNEVKAAVHPVVHYVPSVQPTLIVEVSFELIVDVLDDSLEADVAERQRINVNISILYAFGKRKC